ncbi:MAG: hypothetical protein HY815_01485, partial [Candidatus Riflebacteria bacterium]|nr:hypothetical protein [Candidatus Riflebacteria bacterium]
MRRRWRLWALVAGLAGLAAPAPGQVVNVREWLGAGQIIYKKISRVVTKEPVRVDKKFKTRKIVTDAFEKACKDPTAVGTRLVPGLRVYFAVDYPEDLPGKLLEDQTIPRVDRQKMLLMCGRHFVAQQEEPCAQRFFEAALKLDPRSSEARVALAKLAESL